MASLAGSEPASLSFDFLDFFNCVRAVQPVLPLDKYGVRFDEGFCERSGPARGSIYCFFSALRTASIALMTVTSRLALK
jgi:hypothetical protein